MSLVEELNWEQAAAAARKTTAVRFPTARLEECTELNVADFEVGSKARKFEKNGLERVETGMSWAHSAVTGIRWTAT